MNKEFDFVIRGEGEFPMLELCRTLDKGGKLIAVESLSFRADGQIAIPSRHRNVVQVRYGRSISPGKRLLNIPI